MADAAMADAARHMLSECIKDACGEDVHLPGWVAGVLREALAAVPAPEGETEEQWGVRVVHAYTGRVEDTGRESEEAAREFARHCRQFDAWRDVEVVQRKVGPWTPVGPEEAR